MNRTRHQSAGPLTRLVALISLATLCCLAQVPPIPQLAIAPARNPTCLAVECFKWDGAVTDATNFSAPSNWIVATNGILLWDEWADPTSWDGFALVISNRLGMTTNTLPTRDMFCNYPLPESTVVTLLCDQAVVNCWTNPSGGFFFRLQQFDEIQSSTDLVNWVHTYSSLGGSNLTMTIQ